MTENSTEETFSCKKCCFFTKNKKDYERHLETLKHKKSGYSCEICGKTYKFQSGLSRHKQKHLGEEVVKSVVTTDSHTQEKKIETLEKMLLTALEDNKRTLTTLLPKIGNTYNTTNKMTINVFLNEQCKDAISLDTFVQNLQLSMEDLEYTTDHGYVKGISNIFIKHLQGLKPTERPIHCSDKKRMQFYIKEKNKWEKDDSSVRLDKSISQVSRKQIKQIKEWEEQHPNWNESDNETEMYWRMIQQVMGGKDSSEIEKNKINIKKELGNTVDLKKAIEEL